MKSYLKTIALMAAVAMLWVGCKKDENRIFFEGGTAPTLAISSTNITLTPQTETNQAVKFSWTNPDYKFTTGVSSHDVQYALEFDINQQFNSANRFVTTIARDLERTFTVFDLNRLLGNQMLLPLEQNVTVYVRVVSSLRFEGATNAALTSNVVSFTTRPYAPPPAVDLPSSGELWLVGGATPNGWNNPTTANQQFTRVSNTLYEITIQLNGSAFLMLPVNGSWDDKYGWDGANELNNTSGDRMARGGGDIKAPTAPGMYKITADFQIGRFTITPQ